MAPKRPDELATLTGRLSDRLYPPGISLPNGGGKFTPDGAVQIWPGNTFICHIDRASTAYQAILELQEDIKTSEFNRFFTFLPPPSFHMTVFQGLSPDMEPGTGWPANVPAGLSRDEVTCVLRKRLEQLELPVSFKIRVDGLFAGHSLTVSGADEHEETALRQARVALRDATGISFADFDDYVFHITLAYRIAWLSEKTAHELIDFSAQLGIQFKDAIGPIGLDAVEFCNFESMHHFELVKALS